ncbi:MAG TPA: hypothetical protein VFU73_03950, partial [Actinocrinis sp.]|nr:hypothetical protein [Actinocrinis sp.]
TLLRSTAFFHAHGATKPTLILTLWTTTGLALYFLGNHHTHHTTTTTANTTPDTQTIQTATPTPTTEPATV